MSSASIVGGMRIEPFVSSPNAATTICAAKIAPLPPMLPTGVRVGSYAPRLVWCERSPRALRQIAKGERSDLDAHQSQDLDADFREDAPQLTILPFVERDLEPRTAS